MSRLRTSQPYSQHLLSVLRGSECSCHFRLHYSVSEYQTRFRYSTQRPPTKTRPSDDDRVELRAASKRRVPRQQQTQAAEDFDGLQSIADLEAHHLQAVAAASAQKVRYLRPFLWVISASAGIYTLLAYKEARDSLQPKTLPQVIRVQPELWQSNDQISKLTLGVIATTGAVHLTSYLVPGYWDRLWHLPVRNVNYTLFTSTFVHSGPMHLLVNMWACYNFMRPVGFSRLFEANANHLLSFFLATGVLSGYAQHLSARLPSTARTIPSIFIRSGGASGALFGIFGVFCEQYPNAGVGILFVPFSIAASTMLPLVMAFDTYGVVRGFRSLNLGHAAHLSGALIGFGYSYLDGKNRIWKPMVQFFRQRLRKA